MIDNIFGELEYDFLWEGKTIITMFGIEYEIGLGINGEEDEIGQLQRDAYIYFREKESEIMKTVCSEIYEYYIHICEYEPEKLDAGVVGKLPKVSDVMDMKELIVPIQLCIPESDNDREIDILFECKWDFELGVGVRILNEEVTKVGVQNDVL